MREAPSIRWPRRSSRPCGCDNGFPERGLVALAARCAAADARESRRETSTAGSFGPERSGAWPACVLLRADSHPDLHAVGLAEDAQQVKVDQIRALIETLSLSSYRGGYKVAIVE